MITVQTSLTMTRMSPTRDDSHVIEVEVSFLSLCPSLTHFRFLFFPPRSTWTSKVVS